MNDRRAPKMYMTLAADGAREEESQLSLPRKAFMALCATLLLLSAPLLWFGVAQAGADSPSAVLSKSGSDDEENSGPGGDDDDDEPTGNNTGTGTGDGTKGENTADDDTRGKTGDNRDEATGRETQAKNTDRPGLHTGVSTRGETDPGDKTGKTERR